MVTKKLEKNGKYYICKCCNFKTLYNSNYQKHLLTAKHIMITNGNKKMGENGTPFICSCGKKYNYRSGLSRHKNMCNFKVEKTTIITSNIINSETNGNAILDLISQNKELMNLLVVQNQEHKKETQQLKDTIHEIIPKIGNNNTTNNNNNNTFNLQLFLNEDCKDAINFSEFIENIKISFEDLEHQAEVGYINGVSKLFIENLRDLGTHKRPIHCTDKKRKTLYIKENNEWDKEGSQDKLKKGIREVSRKGFECLMKEKQENQEEYKDIDSDFTQKCLSIHRNILPGVPPETTISKVIEKISQNSGINE